MLLLLWQGQPYLELKKDANDRFGNDRFEGYCADLAKAICDRLGIEFELQLVKDGKFGEKMNNGTWNGMVGELTRKVSQAVLSSQDRQHGNCFFIE